MGILSAISLVVAVIAVARSVVIVPSREAWILERLGRYLRTLPPGLHVRLVLIDRVARKHSLDVRETDSSDAAITLDNIPVNVTSAFSWQILDPEKATYGSADVAEFTKTLVRTMQRKAIGERPWRDARETTRELQQAILRALDEPAATVGVSVGAFSISRIDRAP